MSSGYIDTTKVKKIGDLLNLNSSPLVKLLMSIEGIKDIKIESLEGQLDKNGNQEERPFYDANKKTIFMYYEKESTILHEIIHAVTSNYLKDNKTSKFHLQLKALYQDYNNHITKNNLERSYALTDLSEFIAEGLSNPKIIEQLKTIQYTNNKSIFEKLVDIVKEFFGTISQENLYDNLLRGFGEYLTENFNLNNLEQQAQQLYSQYLDTIFPDSQVKEIDDYLYNSVLNQLDQENKIEKDCSGGNLKAKDGIRGKFTKGSQWEIVKDLKGYPSHSQGGVDVKIGKNGFSFTRDNGIIEAKHGLVLPKIK